MFNGLTSAQAANLRKHIHHARFHISIICPGSATASFMTYLASIAVGALPVDNRNGQPLAGNHAPQYPHVSLNCRTARV